MCGRFAQERPASELAEIFAAEPLADELGPRYNVAPTDDALVVVQREERRAITAYRWGLVPHWSTDLKAGSRMFNARAETITTSPAFRAAFQRRRCLVPVDAFYEWKREGTVRQPYAIGRDDGRPLVLAGLWAGWRDPASDPEAPLIRRTFTHRDDDPQRRSMAELHDRMPVVLPDDAWDRWLDPTPADPGELLALLQPTDEIALRIYAVERAGQRRAQGWARSCSCPLAADPAAPAGGRRPSGSEVARLASGRRASPRTPPPASCPGIDRRGVATDRVAEAGRGPSAARTRASAGSVDVGVVSSIGRVERATTRWAPAQAAAATGLGQDARRRVGRDDDPVVGQVAQGQADVGAIERRPAPAGVDGARSVGVVGRRIDRSLVVRRDGRRVAPGRAASRRARCPPPRRRAGRRPRPGRRRSGRRARPGAPAAAAARAIAGGQPRRGAASPDPDASTAPMTTITGAAYCDEADPLGHSRQSSGAVMTASTPLSRMTLDRPAVAADVVACRR